MVLRRQWSQLRKQKDARKAHGNTQCEHLVTCKYQSVKWNRGYVTHGIEATCASPNGIEAKCAVQDGVQTLKSTGIAIDTRGT